MEQINTLLVSANSPFGLTDVDILVKLEGASENENESVAWVEYWHPLAVVDIDPLTAEQMLSWPTDPTAPDAARSHHIFPPSGEGPGLHPPVVYEEGKGVCVHRSAAVVLKQMPEEVKTMLGQLTA